MKQSYRLQSSGLVGAPGVVQWAINGYRFPDKNDRDAMINLITGTWKGVSYDAAVALLSEQIPYRIENGIVFFEYEPHTVAQAA